MLYFIYWRTVLIMLFFIKITVLFFLKSQLDGVTFNTKKILSLEGDQSLNLIYNHSFMLLFSHSFIPVLTFLEWLVSVIVLPGSMTDRSLLLGNQNLIGREDRKPTYTRAMWNWSCAQWTMRAQDPHLA